MKNKKIAFTLIELLVVTTIVILLSISGSFYFFDFIKKQELISKLELIQDDIDSLDKQVNNYQILDYEILFDTRDNYSPLYIKYLNNFDVTNQTLELTNSSWSWVIKTNNTWTWTIKIYKNHKLFKYEEIDRTVDFNFDFNEVEKYTVMWTQNSDILNEIKLKYYSKTNIEPEKNDILQLIWINTKQDKTWVAYSSVSIQNINWIKKFYNNNTEILNSDIYLFFENNWLQNFIQITK